MQDRRLRRGRLLIAVVALVVEAVGDHPPGLDLLGDDVGGSTGAETRSGSGIDVAERKVADRSAGAGAGAGAELLFLLLERECHERGDPNFFRIFFLFNVPFMKILLERNRNRVLRKRGWGGRNLLGGDGFGPK